MSRFRTPRLGRPGLWRKPENNPSARRTRRYDRPLLRFLAAAVGRALLSGGEPSQGGFFAEVLAQAPDVFDGHENSMTLGVVELKVLGRGTIGRFEQPSSRIAAQPMGGVQDELTGIERGSELRWQVMSVYPLVGTVKHGSSGNIRSRRALWRAPRRPGAGNHHESNGNEVTQREALTQKQ